ncbi:MAG: hypothetical protein JO131_09370 [Gammaproteobacteria bacterium]|nr:hypothetical protein [Gammaproteobacteria bacterium]
MFPILAKIGSALLSLIPPAEAFLGIIKRLINFNTPYPATTSSEGPWSDDRMAKTLPYTFAISRGAVLLVTAFLVLGFLGSLAVPFPGVAPLYGAGVVGIAKACGIAIGYTTAARTLGTFFGAICDARSINLFKDTPISTSSSLVMKITIQFGLSKILAAFLSMCRKTYPKQVSSESISPSCKSTSSFPNLSKFISKSSNNNMDFMSKNSNNHSKKDNNIYHIYHRSSKNNNLSQEHHRTSLSARRPSQ